jgi:hypothetical protein
MSAAASSPAASLFGHKVLATVELVPGKLTKEIVVQSKAPGETAPRGAEVKAHYIGKLRCGSDFDSSRKRGRPFTFPLGQGKVIKGWDVGMATMGRGEKAVFTIAPEYGYGAAGAGGVIPGGATLVFEVEMVRGARRLACCCPTLRTLTALPPPARALARRLTGFSTPAKTAAQCSYGRGSDRRSRAMAARCPPAAQCSIVLAVPWPRDASQPCLRASQSCLIPPQRLHYPLPRRGQRGENVGTWCLNG